MKKQWNGCRLFLCIVFFVSFFQLSACTTIKNSCASIDASQTIAVLPFTNMTETPQADDRVSAITTDVLRTRGFRHVVSFPPARVKPSLIPGVKEPIPRERLLEWARSQGADYALTGSVTEWNYKVGLDGEPAVGVNMELINLKTGEVIWTAVGSKIGGSRMAVSQVGIDLIYRMLGSIKRWQWVTKVKSNVTCSTAHKRG